MNSGDANWMQTVVDRVALELERSDTDSLRSLLRRLPGLDPTLVVRALSEVSDSRSTRRKAAFLLESAIRPSPRLPDPAEHRLPPPHPVDYEWRFDPATRHRLSTELLERSKPGGNVLLLGCPTIALELLDADTDREVTLVDANPTLPLLSASPRYRQMDIDLLDHTPIPPPADVVLTDPPFYDPHLQAFLLAASVGARDGACVIVAVPPPLTRPKAQQEVAGLTVFAESLGLLNPVRSESELRYLRPPFERRAHEAAGLFGIPDDWRVADVIRFARSGTPTQLPIVERKQFCWHEATTNAIRWRVRVSSREGSSSTEDEAVPTLVPVHEGDALDSVSGRDQRRVTANVWTDGNVALATTHPKALLRALHALGEGRKLEIHFETQFQRTLTGPEHAAISELLRQIFSVRR